MSPFYDNLLSFALLNSGQQRVKMGNMSSSPKVTDDQRSSLIDRAYGHAAAEAAAPKSCPKLKLEQPDEPAFSGYVTGWRQGDFADNAQEIEFELVTFQHDGYEGDDEDSEYPDCSHVEIVPSSPIENRLEIWSKRNAPLAAPDGRAWEGRQNGGPQRVRCRKVGEEEKSQAERSKQNPQLIRMDSGGREKRLNSSHAAMLRGSATGATVKMTLGRDESMAGA